MQAWQLLYSWCHTRPLLYLGVVFMHLCLKETATFSKNLFTKSSVADPDPNQDLDPSDPYVFGPPGSGSGSTRQNFGSGSVSSYHQAKIVRKTLIPTVL
jgi:hypothetical protein